jgi:hypothetical protein
MQQFRLLDVSLSYSMDVEPTMSCNTSNSIRQFLSPAPAASLAQAIHSQVPLVPPHHTVLYASGLTSVLNRVATPTALITLHKQSDDDSATLEASFQKTLSTTKQVIALANNNLFTRFYVVTPHRRIHPIFQPQRCTLTDPDTGLEHEFLLGHGSNDPRLLHAEYTHVEGIGTFACIGDTSTANVPTCYHSGPSSQLPTSPAPQPLTSRRTSPTRWSTYPLPYQYLSKSMTRPIALSTSPV